MAPSARINAQPHVEMKYWTAGRRDQRYIEEWIDEQDEITSHLHFYSSFINTCHKQVDKLRHPFARYPHEYERVMAEKVRSVLRQQPLDVREFIGLMEGYSAGGWKSGDKTGQIAKPYKASK